MHLHELAALVREVAGNEELPVLGERLDIGQDQASLCLRHERQAVALDAAQWRAEVRSRVVGDAARIQDELKVVTAFLELRVRVREGRRRGQPLGQRGRQLEFEAIGFGRSLVDRHRRHRPRAATGDRLRDLHVLRVDEVNRAIRPQPPVEPCALDTELIVVRCLLLIGRLAQQRAGGSIDAARPGALGVDREQQHVVRGPVIEGDARGGLVELRFQRRPRLAVAAEKIGGVGEKFGPVLLLLVVARLEAEREPLGHLEGQAGEDGGIADPRDVAVRIEDAGLGARESEVALLVVNLVVIQTHEAAHPAARRRPDLDLGGPLTPVVAVRVGEQWLGAWRPAGDECLAVVAVRAELVVVVAVAVEQVQRPARSEDVPVRAEAGERLAGLDTVERGSVTEAVVRERARGADRIGVEPDPVRAGRDRTAVVLVDVVDRR